MRPSLKGSRNCEGSQGSIHTSAAIQNTFSRGEHLVYLEPMNRYEQRESYSHEQPVVQYGSPCFRFRTDEGEVGVSVQGFKTSSLHRRPRIRYTLVPDSLSGSVLFHPSILKNTIKRVGASKPCRCSARSYQKLPPTGIQPSRLTEQAASCGPPTVQSFFITAC